MNESKANLRMLLRHTMTAWRGWLGLGGITLVASLVSLLHPWPLKLLIDYVLSGLDMPLWAQSVRELLPGASSAIGLAVYVAMAGVLLFIVDATLDAVNARAWIRTGQRVVYQLAAKIFAHAQRLSIVRQSRLQVGEVLSTVTADCWCVYSVASAMIFTPIQSLVMIGVAFSILWRLDPTLAVVSLAIAPPMAVIAALSGRWNRLSFGGQRDSEARVEALVQQTLAGIPLVQSFAQEDRHLRELMILSGAAIGAQRRTALLGGIGHLLSSIVTAVGSAIIIVLGARMALAGALSVGDLLIFLTYLGMMHGELSNLLSSYTTIQHSRSSLGRIEAILGQPIDIESPSHPLPLPLGAADAVTLDSAWFGYRETLPIIRGVKLRISSGETIGIVGPSGGAASLVSTRECCLLFLRCSLN